MDTDQVVARFEAERQALAMMDHPSIARVFDAGATGSGRPYFVMELVNGVPITEYCDRVQLAMRERLSLFLPVCHAIQHAHQKGIIHRDIKPSNVLVTMVDGQPVPKVIDFGVAKAVEQRLTERTLFTQFGTMVGTLEYMSPEQAELLGDEHRHAQRHLRAGRPAVRAADRHHAAGAEHGSGRSALSEILRRIREEEPPRPSTRLSGSGERLPAIAACRDIEPTGLTRLVRGDLDWIVMKALEKDRTRRYATAVDLARDIQRYLDGDPVEACPPSAAYRFGKLARKHRGALITASAFAAMLATMSAVSTWQAIRATRGRGAVATRGAARRVGREAGAHRGGQRPAVGGRVGGREEVPRDRICSSPPGPRTERAASAGTRRSATAVDRARPKIADAFTDQPTIEAAFRTDPRHDVPLPGRPRPAIPRAGTVARELRTARPRPRPPRHARQPQQPRLPPTWRRPDARGDRDARGDAQAVNREARPRPPRHARHPQQPRRRLPDRRSDGRGDRACTRRHSG